MRLRPVTLIVTLALGLLAGPLPAGAQQAGKVYRIGYLAQGLSNTEGIDFLRQGLRAASDSCCAAGNPHDPYRTPSLQQALNKEK